MIKVIYDGRLGNRLFQYCFGRILAEELGYQLEAEPISGFPGTEERVVGRVVCDEDPLIFSRTDHPDLNQLLNSPPGRSIVVNAYLQDYKYYSRYLPRIRDWLRLAPYDRQEFQSGPETLVLHVRLGDYLQGLWALSPDFYCRIIDSQPHESLIIVTDSPYSNFLDYFEQYTPRIISSDEMSDFRWLTNASKLVLSQSTFGWWAAILSEAEVWMPVTEDSVWSPHSEHIDLRVSNNPKWQTVLAESLPRFHRYVHDARHLRQ